MSLYSREKRKDRNTEKWIARQQQSTTEKVARQHCSSNESIAASQRQQDAMLHRERDRMYARQMSQQDALASQIHSDKMALARQKHNDYIQKEHNELIANTLTQFAHADAQRYASDIQFAINALWERNSIESRLIANDFQRELKQIEESAKNNEHGRTMALLTTLHTNALEILKFEADSTEKMESMRLSKEQETKLSVEKVITERELMLKHHEKINQIEIQHAKASDEKALISARHTAKLEQIWQEAEASIRLLVSKSQEERKTILLNLLCTIRELWERHAVTVNEMRVASELKIQEMHEAAKIRVWEEEQMKKLKHSHSC